MLLASSGQKPEMLLTIPQCTGQLAPPHPHQTKNHSSINVDGKMKFWTRVSAMAMKRSGCPYIYWAKGNEGALLILDHREIVSF